SLTSLFFFSCSAPHPALHSFPTRRSSDLHRPDRAGVADVRYHRPTRDVHGRPERHRRVLPALAGEPGQSRADARGREEIFVSARDRKSTRLNSSHVAISYAVFCLKKKNKK